MRDLKISYGDSRLSKRWVNKKTTFEELCERFKVTRRTTETVAEYQKFTKDRRDTAKDVGGYVLGHLKSGRRKKDTVESRSGITLDADHADSGFIETVEMLFPHNCAIYSTHSHTPKTPRLRVVIPLSRDVTSDEYAALARLVADEIGMDFFDDSTYEPERLMYWPSTPSDGEYVFKVIDGDQLDPDKYLAKLSDWRDCSLWPTSSRQSEVIQRSIHQQQNPLEKEGVVGAFCRSYSIEDTIATFLPDIYEPSAMAGRYDYIPADSSAGVVLYEGKWAFSHHATDPACGKLLNAFDLVRVHKFTDFDDKAGFKAMSELALKDEKVNTLIAEERIAAAETEFAESEDWMSRLQREKSGILCNTLGNLLLILNNDDALSGIRHNKLANQIYGENLPWERPHPPWRDADTAQLVAYVDKRYGTFSARNYELALIKVSDDRAYHPIQEYLNSLPPWDRVPRMDTLLIDYLGAEDSPYTRAVTRKTLVAAVARILSPGVKHDSILVLNGKQGIGKSTLFSKLGRQWYSDSLSISDMKDKTAPEKLQGYWLLELGELAGIKKMDVETVKSFITRTDDKYRPSYGRAVESHPRQCIIVGTTNSDGGFLRDITGNRRFWPVRVSGGGKYHAWELTETDQIWAEAKFRYTEGEELFLKGDIALAAFAEQRDAMENDDREGLVAEYLEEMLPDNWDTMDIYRRLEYIRSTDDPTRAKGTVRRSQVCVMEIWCECFGKSRESIKKADSYEIEGILNRIGGWAKYEGNKTGKKAVPMYGVQRVFVRDK
ncbi:virulence-associated E family protein [Dehalococcoides mccartyi]|uniref:Virulence-associated E family protein n=1 Tax=Dehalococcoides mccartyi TaxID=61435 RepID=A0AB38Z952_9CHLR|nr:virulence-associated E family protein [Dehalococcoides mccartyi]WRO07075.1 virulence-associated E family protein [Dehalococcoides mccartyi]